MSEPPPPKRRAEAWASAWVTAVLAVSALVAVGFKLVLALSPEDTDALESPLVLPVARQLVLKNRLNYSTPMTRKGR